MRTLGAQCIVGEWKIIDNFQVSEPGKHYRATNNKFKISFINQTVIKPSDFQNDDDMFLDLAEFDSVLSGQLDADILIGRFLLNSYFHYYKYFIYIITDCNIDAYGCLTKFINADILGQAIDVGHLQVLQSNGKELKKIEFTLRNIRLYLCNIFFFLFLIDIR